MVAAAVQDALSGVLSSLTADVHDLVRDEVHKVLGRRLDPPPKATAEWLSPKQAAALASVSYDTVLAWISEGKVLATRVGRQFRIRREDLECFMSQPVTAATDKSCDIDAEAARILGGCR